MKRVILFCFTILICMHALAQKKDPNILYEKQGDINKKKRELKRPSNCPDFYVGLSTGYNNPTGYAGADFDLPLGRYFSVDAGGGWSTWGLKIAAGARYYFKRLGIDRKYNLRRCQVRWALGAGLTYANGLHGYVKDLKTISGATTSTELNLNPQMNIFLAGYKFWNVGKKHNRIYAMAGYSLPLNEVSYDQISGEPLSNDAKEYLKRLSPRGPVAGIGFSFGVSN